MDFLSNLSAVEYTIILTTILIILVASMIVKFRYRIITQIIIMVITCIFIYFGSVVEYANGLAFNEGGTFTLYHDNEIDDRVAISKLVPIGNITMEVDNDISGVKVSRNLIKGTSILTNEENLIKINETLK